MKKFIPYVLTLVLGIIVSYLFLSKNNSVLSNFFSEQKNVTAFQIGVFTDISVAKKYQELYKPAIIVKDNDVYRIYYSVLSNSKCIKEMEDYLSKKDINYYLKDFTISSESYITALQKYEEGILDGNEQTLLAINELLLNNYKEAI